MTIELNGERRELPDDATIADAVAATGASDEGKGVACALNGEVVSRTEWGSTSLTESDSIEVVQAVQGG